MDKKTIIIYTLIVLIIAVVLNNLIIPQLQGPLDNDTPPGVIQPEKKTANSDSDIVASPEKQLIHQIRFSIIQELTGGHTYTSATLDYNHDGHTDFVVGNYNQQNYLYINNGDNTFQPTPDFGTKKNTRSIATADFNNDGWQDVVVGNYNQQNAVFINNKDSTFTENLLDGRDATMVIMPADLDGDKLVDIIEGTEEQGIYIYHNLGDGQYDKLQISADKYHVRSLTPCNLNNEGLDIIVGTDFDQNYILKNDGDLKFTLVPEFGEKQHTTSIACTDLNKDGRFDVAVVGKSQLGKDLTKNYLYINNGNYVFEKFPQFGNAFSNVVLTADFNNDGKTDVFVGNYEGQSHVYENQGDLKFKELPAFSAEQTKISGMTPTSGKDYIMSATIGDWNGDGFLDLAATRDVEKSTVYVNG